MDLMEWVYSEKCNLDISNLLIAGTTVKKTDKVYGCCVYTGAETKLALNSSIKRHKFATVEDSLNYFLFFFLGLLLVEMVGSACVSVYTGKEYVMPGKEKAEEDHWYLYNPDKTNDKGVYERGWVWGFYMLLHWFLIYNYLIPISLYACIEVQRLVSSLLFGWDVQMYDEERDIRAKCINSDITEELGLITHVFTDKTGTLTENQMVLKRYYTVSDARVHEVQDLAEESWNPFLQTMLLCHTVEVEDGGKAYVAESPDEDALVTACRDHGWVLTENSLKGELTIVREEKTVLRYTRLQELSFDSFRKCMSVVVKDDQGQIYVYSKGAEVALLEYDEHGEVADWRHQALGQVIHDFSSKGLRTLVYGYKRISQAQYDAFARDLKEAQSAQRDRTVAVRNVYTQLEQDFNILAATGIEDKLQDGVFETIRAVRKAGISIWMLTGDKKETALTIARAAGLIERPVTILDLSKKTPLEVETKIDDCLQHPELFVDQTTLLINGKAVGHLMKYDEWKTKLHELCERCTAVIASRLSPIQKSQIVRIIKEADPRNTTLAIGDGGNDVSMIQEAHVGIGLVGHEGTGASLAADFSFGKFRFLQRAMFVHGHWNYQRLAYVIQYSFFKNAACFTVQLFYAFYSNFSARSVFDEGFLMLYNALYAMFPVMTYGALEKTFPSAVLMENPQLYAINRHNKLLSIGQLLLWLTVGLFESAAVFFPTYAAWSTFDLEGFDSWSFGLFMAGTMLTVITFKILIDSRHWTFLFVASVALSFALFVSATMFISEVWVASDIYLIYPRIVSSPGLWSLFVICVSFAILPDILLQYMYDSRAMVLLADLAARMTSSEPRLRMSMAALSSYREI